jgi:hypothetical protein
MTGGTDHGYWTDGDDRVFAPRLLAQERARDAVYEARAWAKGIAWAAFFASLGAAIRAAALEDYLALSTALTAMVLVFWPRVDGRIIQEVIKTTFIRRGLIKQPGGEVLIRTEVKTRGSEEA